MKIIINGDAFDIEVEHGRRGNQADWKSYTNNVTFTDKNSFTKIRLNPKQSFKGTLHTKVMGLDLAKFSDKKVVFILNGAEYTNFTFKAEYDINKQIIKKVILDL